MHSRIKQIKYLLVRNNIIIALIFAYLFFAAGSKTSININDEQEVIEDMQGDWVGYDHENGFYSHYRLIINNSSFKGWYEATYTIDEPNWPSSPDETGTFSLSPVQGYTNSTGKYRNINFYKLNGNYENNSLTARAFTKRIIYDESGLYIVGWGNMKNK
jgi:hypothetical protein